MATSTYQYTAARNTQLAVFSRAYYMYKNALCSYAYYKTSNRALTEDLVQETFIKTWKYLVKHGEVHSMRAFLYHVLKHLIVDEYRKQKMVSLEAMLEKGFDPASHTHERLPDIFDGRKAAALITELPDKYETVVRMRFIEDLSLKEIAERTGRTRNTVTVQSHRGLERLRALYADHEMRVSTHALTPAFRE